MAAAIRFALSNFTLTLLVVGIVAALASLTRVPKATAPRVVEALLFYFLMFSIGLSYLYNFVLHTFFGAMAARFIGWPDSPFQAEVGFASLGFAVVGFLACWRSFDMRLAAILGPAMFLWGAAGGHIYQIVHAGNFAPGNAGVILYTDVLIPMFGFVLLWLQHRYGRPTA
jgi:uncharacterized protein DUF6790